ncbi:MAG: protein translocase subunit SecD [bacterium]
MNTRVVHMIFSKLMFWIAVLVVGSYFLFSFNTKALEKVGPVSGFTNIVKKYLGAIKMPRLKLGIDLQGGTYLVLGVEVDKAIENRLGLEKKALTDLFKKKGLKVLPKKMDVIKTSLNLDFDDEDNAKVCYNLIRAEVPTLRVVLKDNDLICTLTPVEEQRIRTGAVEQAVSVLSNRLSGFGVEGITVQQHGEKQVVVQMPGVDDPERVKSVITKTALLEFKIVEKEGSTKEELLDEYDGELPPDKTIVVGKNNRKNYDEDEEVGRWYLVSAFPDLTGDHIVDARISFDEFNRVEVAFQLDAMGARDFRELTGNNIGRSLGIIIDDVMFSSPTIQSAIGGNGRITGISNQIEAKDLALVLRSGALLAPLKFEQENRVGASLGQDSIRKGLISCLVALLLLFGFSIFYYKLAGIFAFLALFFNLFLILLFLSYFEATLTLPGIAGMVLTIGMAIDASILIYEKIKEELQTGATYRKALSDGFSGAMVVILDSNITTFLTGVVLFKFGGPAIRGFAVTLMVGIIATVLSGVYFLHSIFDFILDNSKIKSIKI